MQIIIITFRYSDETPWCFLLTDSNNYNLYHIDKWQYERDFWGRMWQQSTDCRNNEARSMGKR